MIRRLVWAGLGAALGISAYRRIGRRLAALTPAGRGGRRYATVVPPATAAAFLADLREGRAEYLARYSADPAPDRSGRAGSGRPGGFGPRAGSDYVKDGQ
jgi:hypothetical protein